MLRHLGTDPELHAPPSSQSGPVQSPALVQLRESVSKFPDFVRYIVQRLRTLCPALGKVTLAQILALAGLHLSIATVG